MKNVIIVILILLFAGALFSCDQYLNPEEEKVDPCTTVPNCIPDLSNWKLHYKPHHSECTMCHTTCAPNAAHAFCTEGESWNAAEDRCLKCHPSQHL
jgi:hypothetical protein